MRQFSTLSFSSLATAATVFLGSLAAAPSVTATTLATFGIDGEFSYTGSSSTSDGSTFSVNGLVTGDASSAGPTDLVQPLIFSASGSGSLSSPFPIGPVTLFDGSTDPIMASLDEVTLFAAGLTSFLLAELSLATGGVSDSVVAYLLGNTGGPFEFVPGYTIDFLYTDDPLFGPIAGDYALTIVSGDGVAPLDTVVSDFLGLDAPTSAFLAGGFEGNFEASFAISTVAPVPLPASMPMLAVGGIALYGIARRRKKS